MHDLTRQFRPELAISDCKVLQCGIREKGSVKYQQ